MKRAIKSVFSLYLTAFFITIQAEFQLALNGIPVSIPDQVETVEECSIGIPSNDGIAWVPFSYGMQQFYGGPSGQYRSGNASLTITFDDGSRWTRLEQQRFIASVSQLVQHIKTERETRKREIAAQEARRQRETEQQQIRSFKRTQLTQQIATQQEPLEAAYLAWSEDGLNARYQQRADALKALLSEQTPSVQKRQYVIAPRVQKFIKKHDTKAVYTELEATILQHALHQELLRLYEEAVELTGAQAGFYQEHIGTTGALARQANEEGQVLFASQLLDWGWTLLEYGKAAALGVQNGVVNTAHAITHPLQTLKGMAQGVLHIAQLTLQATQATAGLVYDAATSKERFDARVASYQTSVEQFCRTITETPATDLIRRTTAFLTEAVLLHKTVSALSRLKTIAHSSSRKAVQFIEQIEQPELVVVTAEGIELSPAHYFEQMAAPIEASSTRMRGKVKSTLVGAEPLFIPFEQELLKLEQRFNDIIKGMGPFEQSYIDFAFRHIFEGNPLLDKNGNFISISGFHHDLLKVIEKAGRIQGVPFTILERKNGVAGTYQLVFKGKHRNVPKTFFPADWSREQVTRKIIEAYKHAKRHKCNPTANSKGNLSYYGYTKEKILVRIVVNEKSGNIITAFPEIG